MLCKCTQTMFTKSESKVVAIFTWAKNLPPKNKTKKSLKNKTYLVRVGSNLFLSAIVLLTQQTAGVNITSFAHLSE